MSGKFKPGDRIGAIASFTDDTVYLYGYGVYGGTLKVPNLTGHSYDPGMEPVGDDKLILDSGQVIWGSECWWGSEEDIKGFVAEHENIIDALSSSAIMRRDLG
jgi:hypothetical protein